MVITSGSNEAVARGEIDQAEANRIPLLIALFRVCDAADVGVHRAFYAHVINERIVDEVLLRARRDVRACPRFGDEWVARLREAVVDYLERLPDDLPNELPPLTVAFDKNRLEGHLDESAIFKDIEDWAWHCIEQVAYVRHHQHVLSVHLAMEPRNLGGWNLVPYVEPVDEKSWQKARLAVATDVHRELGDQVEYGGYDIPASTASDAWKTPVKTLLHQVGISVGFPVRMA